MAGKRLPQALPFERHLPLESGGQGSTVDADQNVPFGALRAPPPRRAGRTDLSNSFEVRLPFFRERFDPFLGVF
jgi:hypothetical protein